TIIVIDNLVTLHDLRLAVGAVAIERAELLAFLLAGDVPGADLLRGRGIDIVDDLQTFAIKLVGILAAGVDRAVVNIEDVGLAVGGDWQERELLRFGRIGHVVERNARFRLLAGGLFVGIAARVVVMAEDQYLLLPVDAQIVAARTRIAGNKGERLDVLWIAHVGDHDAE